MLNAFSKLNILENFFTIGDDWRDMYPTNFDCFNECETPIQFDSLLGYVNAIQEMLNFTSEKNLRILPACPKEFSKGSARLKFYSGTVDLHWDLDNKECKGVITANKDTEFTIQLPFNSEDKKVTLKKNEKFCF
jgi:alpha-L-fucosidase 2